MSHGHRGPVLVFCMFMRPLVCAMTDISSLTKEHIRTHARAIRAGLDNTTRASIAEHIALEGVKIARKALARTVGLYIPINDEIDCHLLTLALHYHEFITALPCVIGPQRPLIFRAWTPRDKLITGAYNIPEPSQRLPEVIPDIIFLPVVAFDRAGYRLGYGAGFYDRTLRALETVKPPLTIGIAYSGQEVEDIMPQDHDVRLDLILTEKEIISCTGF
jgi:5-formyltetrahydrofolate cyclo-ligase